MIYAKQAIKTLFESKTEIITANFVLNVRELTNISAEDIAKLEIGMLVTHTSLKQGTKILAIFVDKVSINHQPIATASVQIISVGRGLDIFFKEIENLEFITLKRWLFLDSIEGLMNQFPSIEIIGDEIETNYLTEDSPDTRAWDDCWFVIRIMHAGNNRADITNWILYCREVIKRLIDHDNTFNGNFDRVKLEIANLSELYKFKNQPDYIQILEQNLVARKLAIN